MCAHREKLTSTGVGVDAPFEELNAFVEYSVEIKKIRRQRLIAIEKLGLTELAHAVSILRARARVRSEK
jgi:hypothetical protein